MKNVTTWHGLGTLIKSQRNTSNPQYRVRVNTAWNFCIFFKFSGNLPALKQEYSQTQSLENNFRELPSRISLRNVEITLNVSNRANKRGIRSCSPTFTRGKLASVRLMHRIPKTNVHRDRHSLLDGIASTKLACSHFRLALYSYGMNVGRNKQVSYVCAKWKKWWRKNCFRGNSLLV